MLWRDLSKILGYFFFYFALIILIPLGLAAYYEFFSPIQDHPQPHSTIAFIDTFIVCMLLSAFLMRVGKNSTGNIFRREGLALVVMIWFITPFIAAMPFYFGGVLNHPMQAYFEATSGLTTTGASTMTAKKFNDTGEEIPIERVWPGPIDTTYIFWGNIDPVREPRSGEIIAEGIEAVSKAILFWRSMLNWLGGGGIILLFAAILPALGVGGKVMFQAETTGPVKSSLTPRLKETAAHLWKIYIGLTLLEVFFLMWTNEELPFFDAITISFATISTGGFSVKNASIGAYQNNWTEWVVIIFMILGSINFTLYFYALYGKFYKVYDPELFLFVAILFVACALGIPYLIGTSEFLLSGVSHIFNWSDAIRVGTFQIVTAATTTGFVTADYDKWPYAFQAIMLIMSYVGGMSGSTSGGIKIVRHYILFKIAQYKVESLFRPETIRSFRIGNNEVSSNNAIFVLVFFLTVISISVFGTLLYIMNGVDPETSIGLVTCMLNNTGFAFRMAGPTESCAFLTNFGLSLSVILMILGRLEFFAVLAILVPAFWKQK